MKIETGVIYWGNVGKSTGNRFINKRVDIIETRSSGSKYVRSTQMRKDGTEGQQSWSLLSKFEEWAKGIYARD